MNLNHILFLRALLVHVDQLQTLLGEQWPELQEGLNGLLNDLIGEQDEQFLPSRVNRIYRLFDGTPAGDLARELFKQSGEQDKQMERSTRIMKITDPATLRTRTLDLHEDASSGEDLIVVARELLRAVAPREPDEDAGVHGGLIGETRGSVSSSTENRQLSSVASQQKDPPRNAYALLKCPGRVRPLSRFPVTIGLSETQVEGVFGEKLRRPDSSVGPYTLTVRLVHDGFRLDDTETSEVKLWVTADDPYPAVERHLTALKDDSLNDDRVLIAQYYVNGQMIGAAARYIEVTAEAADTADMAEETTGGGCDMTVPTHKNAPDMTLTISSGNTARGDRLIWSMDTIHPELKKTIPKKEEDLESNLGDSPGEWAKGLMNKVNSMEGDIDLEYFLKDYGARIADKIPYWIRKRLVALSNHITDRAPTLLIISAEPHVPWELAYMWLGEHRGESFLSMEFVIGRWILGTCDLKTDKLKPSLPPPDTVTVNDMFVISGDYSETKGWNRLEAAEKEAACLQARYRAQPVNATKQELVPWLETGVEAELIHFSLHGKFDASGVKDGLALIDGEMLDPRVVREMTLKRKPFVFLNACQVGQSNTILGDYGGMAEAFLRADASGVIAPLWSVDDKTAKGIAERFYKGLENGEDPGELMRRQRQGFKDNPQSGTFLAYLFFGHPRMQIIGVKSQAGERCDE